MEAVNGMSDADKGGPTAPSPLTGCYLLIVVGEPHSQEHKDIILRRIAKGLLSWDASYCYVDLEKELAIITEQAPEGEDARYGERLIQFASENLVTEILIHPAISTLSQCMKNLLSSFTRHRHIIHSGYTYAANGSWILQDGTFSLADFSEAFQEVEVQRILRAYDNSISLDIHCSPEGDWTRLPKESFTKNCKVRVNPDDVLSSGSPSIGSFLSYISPFHIPTDIETLLESSDVVGNIRFSHPTLYVFPGGQGDAALFGINGFNMLVDGGFARKSCFWDFVRHLDRLDAVLLTRLNNSNINGISSLLRRKKFNTVYPQIGHFFCNIQERKSLLSPDGDKDKDPLLINLLEEGQELFNNLKQLNLQPQPCYRDIEPINLYHKVGHGTLDMYVISPARDSKEVKEFLQKWNSNDQKLFSNQRSAKDFLFPIQNLISICALLVWQPANANHNITRILFPGSTPQHKIFEGLDKLKQLECIKHPSCTAKTIAPVVIKSKYQKSEKIFPDQKDFKMKERLIQNDAKNKIENKMSEEIIKNGHTNGVVTDHIMPTKVMKKHDSTESENSGPKSMENKKIEDKKDVADKVVEEKVKAKPRVELKPKPEPKALKKSRSIERKPKPVLDKKPSPTTPKKTIDAKVNGDLHKFRAKTSPSATPAKSTKEANNRKVVESKYKAPPKRDVSKQDKKEVKDKKLVSKKAVESSPSRRVFESPIKKPTELQKVESRRAKIEKEGTTDSSTVSTPSAADADSMKKDLSKLTPEELEQLKARELAELKEEQEVVNEIEAVFRKSESKTKSADDPDLRKVKSISIDDKTDGEEYLIIEKEVIDQDSLDDRDMKDGENQKHLRDSEESEKQRKLSSDAPLDTKNQLDEKVDEKNKLTERTPPTADIAHVVQSKDVSKDMSATSPEEKLDASSGKKIGDRDIDEENRENNILESQPDEKYSTPIESGATTAPTLPEDERIPLDEIKEDNADQVIEEKYVKEDTKEKETPALHLPPASAECVSKLPNIVGIRLDKQTPIRDIVKTPDEVADLPMHEVVDSDNYEQYQASTDPNKQDENKHLNVTKSVVRPKELKESLNEHPDKVHPVEVELENEKEGKEDDPEKLLIQKQDITSEKPCDDKIKLTTEIHDDNAIPTSIEESEKDNDNEKGIFEKNKAEDLKLEHPQTDYVKELVSKPVEEDINQQGKGLDKIIEPPVEHIEDTQIKTASVETEKLVTAVKTEITESSARDQKADSTTDKKESEKELIDKDNTSKKHSKESLPEPTAEDANLDKPALHEDKSQRAENDIDSKVDESGFKETSKEVDKTVLPLADNKIDSKEEKTNTKEYSSEIQVENLLTNDKKEANEEKNKEIIPELLVKTSTETKTEEIVETVEKHMLESTRSTVVIESESQDISESGLKIKDEEKVADLDIEKIHEPIKTDDSEIKTGDENKQTNEAIDAKLDETVQLHKVTEIIMEPAEDIYNKEISDNLKIDKIIENNENKEFTLKEEVILTKETVEHTHEDPKLISDDSKPLSDELKVAVKTEDKHVESGTLKQEVITESTEKEARSKESTTEITNLLTDVDDKIKQPKEVEEKGEERESTELISKTTTELKSEDPSIDAVNTKVSESDPEKDEKKSKAIIPEQKSEVQADAIALNIENELLHPKEDITDVKQIEVTEKDMENISNESLDITTTQTKESIKNIEVKTVDEVIVKSLEAADIVAETATTTSSNLENKIENKFASEVNIHKLDGEILETDDQSKKPTDIEEKPDLSNEKHIEFKTVEVQESGGDAEKELQIEDNKVEFATLDKQITNVLDTIHAESSVTETKKETKDIDEIISVVKVTEVISHEIVSELNAISEIEEHIHVDSEDENIAAHDLENDKLDKTKSSTVSEKIDMEKVNIVDSDNSNVTDDIKSKSSDNDINLSDVEKSVDGKSDALISKKLKSEIESISNEVKTVKTDIILQEHEKVTEVAIKSKEESIVTEIQKVIPVSATELEITEATVLSVDDKENTLSSTELDHIKEDHENVVSKQKEEIDSKITELESSNKNSETALLLDKKEIPPIATEVEEIMIDDEIPALKEKEQENSNILELKSSSENRDKILLIDEKESPLLIKEEEKVKDDQKILTSKQKEEIGSNILELRSFSKDGEEKTSLIDNKETPLLKKDVEKVQDDQKIVTSKMKEDIDSTILELKPSSKDEDKDLPPIDEKLIEKISTNLEDTASSKSKPSDQGLEHMLKQTPLKLDSELETTGKKETADSVLPESESSDIILEDLLKASPSKLNVDLTEKEEISKSAENLVQEIVKESEINLNEKLEKSEIVELIKDIKSEPKDSKIEIKENLDDGKDLIKEKIVQPKQEDACIKMEKHLESDLKIVKSDVDESTVKLSESNIKDEILKSTTTEKYTLDDLPKGDSIQERSDSVCTIKSSESEPASKHGSLTKSEIDIVDKMELGRKSPKEREQDVAIIVASVAEVLKSDAPLEEFDGKIPLEVVTFSSYPPYSTELRETHITTVDSPICDKDVSTSFKTYSGCDPISEFITEEKKIASIHEDYNISKPQESKISALLKDSTELIEATSKIISDIKQTSNGNDIHVAETIIEPSLPAIIEKPLEETVVSKRESGVDFKPAKSVDVIKEESVFEKITDVIMPLLSDDKEKKESDSSKDLVDNKLTSAVTISTQDATESPKELEQNMVDSTKKSTTSSRASTPELLAKDRLEVNGSVSESGKSTPDVKDVVLSNKSPILSRASTPSIVINEDKSDIDGKSIESQIEFSKDLKCTSEDLTKSSQDVTVDAKSLDKTETDANKNEDRSSPKESLTNEGLSENVFDLTKSFIENEKSSHCDKSKDDLQIAQKSIELGKSIESTLKDMSSDLKDNESSPLSKDLEIRKSSIDSITKIEESDKLKDFCTENSTPPAASTSVVVETLTKTLDDHDATDKNESKDISHFKTIEVRSSTPTSDDCDISSGQVSRVHTTEDDYEKELSDEDLPGSPLSAMSQVAHSTSSQYDIEDSVRGVPPIDPMSTSFYGALPDDPIELSQDKKTSSFLEEGDLDFNKALSEHRQTRGEDLVSSGSPSHVYAVTTAKYTSSKFKEIPETPTSATVSAPSENLMTSSFIGSQLPTDSKEDPIASWGKPLGLPSPAPLNDNKGTPKKERKVSSNVMAKNKLNEDKKTADSKYDKKKKIVPVYMDLTYVPHHGNSNYSYVDFFKKVRARYYVFSGIEPSKEVYNALLEAKQTWDDKDLEVTIISTYDTDVLGYWVAENEDLLTKCKIDLSPSASRCTINLQDHETSCSAYRLEFS